MVDPIQRLKEVESLINKNLFFTIHAPRQTGKTTYLYSMAGKLNKEDNHIALVVSFEEAGYDSITVKEANEALVDCIYHASIEQLKETYRPENPETNPSRNLKNYLKNWARNQTKPIVLFIDEIDALLDNVLIAVLRQLRDGYQSRPDHFPASVVLVGLRDVRDYKVILRPEQKSFGTGSPFNIKSDSLFLSNFSKQEVFQLLDQHSTDTGQVFPLEVKQEIFRLSQGQPWLTNALARQMVSKILEDDFSKELTPALLKQAKNQLILRRDTHLDSLIDKLREPRVKRIVQSIINGDNLSFDIHDDDIVYVRDLGIVGQESPIQFANPIYAEIVPRILASPMQESIPAEYQPPRFVNKGGSLDMDKILKEFQVFYRRNSGSWLERYEYKESAHHLLLMAFLQRVINAGGEIIREMALGNGRIDLMVKYGPQSFALELKVKWNNYTIEDGKEQLDRYLDTIGLKEGYLVIFDPADIPWNKKLYWEEISYKEKKIVIVGI